MQTSIRQDILNTQAGQTADRILRNCVHCGFCTATCPTYQLLGDELDGPRGRIYLIKQLLEGKSASAKTRLHLDRCLTCRNCETTCPSGVEYSHLLDIGRSIINQQTSRPWHEQLLRKGLLWALPKPARFNRLIKLAQRFRVLLPAQLKRSLPQQRALKAWPTDTKPRKVLLLEGCVQPGLAPNINHATASLLNKLGIQSLRCTQSCCGALAHHLTAEAEAQQTIRDNIDLWWPYVEQGIEAIISNASGCGVMVKDYGHLMQSDPDYADKASTISALCKDISEICHDATTDKIKHKVRVSFQAPCTLQHGQKLPGIVEGILQKAGFQLLEYPDKHLCCGSAGTYSLTQKSISRRLLKNKLTNLLSQTPDYIVTANIGCLLHLQSASPVPVMHWVELLDRELSETS